MNTTLKIAFCTLTLTYFSACYAQETAVMQKPYEGLGKDDNTLLCAYQYDVDYYSLFACVNSTLAANTDMQQSSETIDANTALSLPTKK